MEGNQQKMREVLESATKDLRKVVCEMRDDDCSMFSPDILRSGWANILECIYVAMESALSSPPRVCDVNTLESLSDFVEKTILTSDLLKDTNEIVKRIVMASVRTALAVAYEPAKMK